MLPVLLSLGPVKIYSMGVLLAVGLFLGLFYWWKLGRDEHLEEESLFDSYFLGLAAFAVIGRAGYVVWHATDLLTWYRVIAFLTYPGIAYALGIAASIVVIVAFARNKTWDIWKILDIYAVALSLVLVFGTLGAFLNGSNPGKELGWGLVFPGVSGRHFPVDLWGFVWFVISFGICMRVRRNFRFYSWYKRDASVAKDGLAALIFLGMCGGYYLVKGLVDDGIRWGVMPIESAVGIIILMLSIISIMNRAGRRFLAINIFGFNRKRLKGGRE